MVAVVVEVGRTAVWVSIEVEGGGVDWHDEDWSWVVGVWVEIHAAAGSITVVWVLVEKDRGNAVCDDMDFLLSGCCCLIFVTALVWDGVDFVEVGLVWDAEEMVDGDCFGLTGENCGEEPTAGREEETASMKVRRERGRLGGEDGGVER